MKVESEEFIEQTDTKTEGDASLPLGQKILRQAKKDRIKRQERISRNDFLASNVYKTLQKYKECKLPSVHVPVWCHWVTKNCTQALVLAQINYWFGKVRDPSNAKEQLPRTMTRGKFNVGGQMKEYRCLMISLQMLARQCCLSLEQLRSALRYLEKNMILQSTRASDAIDLIRQLQSSDSSLIKSGVKCYRIDPGGLVTGLIEYLRDIGDIRPSELREPYTPGDWIYLRHKLKTQASEKFRMKQISFSEMDKLKARYSNRPFARRSNVTTDQVEEIPGHAERFVDSPLQSALQDLRMWVTVPHWSILMVKGNLNDAFVLSRIFDWQEHLRRVNEGHLWLEKTHEQLAGEIGMLNPGNPRNRYRRVTRSLERLADTGLIEKLPPKKEPKNRFTRIRLVPEEIQRRWDRIESDDCWIPSADYRENGQS